jgi:hypothetical protein
VGAVSDMEEFPEWRLQRQIVDELEPCQADHCDILIEANEQAIRVGDPLRSQSDVRRDEAGPEASALRLGLDSVEKARSLGVLTKQARPARLTAEKLEQFRLPRNSSISTDSSRAMGPGNPPEIRVTVSDVA